MNHYHPQVADCDLAIKRYHIHGVRSSDVVDEGFPSSIPEGICADERANHLAMEMAFQHVEGTNIDADRFQHGERIEDARFDLDIGKVKMLRALRIRRLV